MTIFANILQARMKQSPHSLGYDISICSILFLYMAKPKYSMNFMKIWVWRAQERILTHFWAPRKKMQETSNISEDFSGQNKSSLRSWKRLKKWKRMHLGLEHNFIKCVFIKTKKHASAANSLLHCLFHVGFIPNAYCLKPLKSTVTLGRKSWKKFPKIDQITQTQYQAKPTSLPLETHNSKLPKLKRVIS